MKTIEFSVRITFDNDIDPKEAIEYQRGLTEALQNQLNTNSITPVDIGNFVDKVRVSCHNLTYVDTGIDWHPAEGYFIVAETNTSEKSF